MSPILQHINILKSLRALLHEKGVGAVLASEELKATAQMEYFLPADNLLLNRLHTLRGISDEALTEAEIRKRFALISTLSTFDFIDRVIKSAEGEAEYALHKFKLAHRIRT